MLTVKLSLIYDKPEEATAMLTYSIIPLLEENFDIIAEDVKEQYEKGIICANGNESDTIPYSRVYDGNSRITQAIERMGLPFYFFCECGKRHRR